MNEFYFALLSVILISFISLSGAVLFFACGKFINKVILVLVAFAAGTLLGASFFDLLPEAVEKGSASIFSYVLVGMLIFFAMERYIHWHHCHSGNDIKKHHPMTYLNLIGDAFHNFVDGCLIAAGFIVSFPLGLVTSFAITMHEIPQEISDFAILIHGGFSKKKAIFFNFIFSLTSVLGVIITFVFASQVNGLIPVILAVAAGGFIYLATADLIPEIHKETNRKNIILQSAALLLGVLLIAVLSNVFKG